MIIEQGICCDVLYYDPEKQLDGCSLKGAVTLAIPLQENANCSVERIFCPEPFCAAGAAGLTVKLPVELSVRCYAEHRLRAVRGGEVTPLEEKGKKPSLILRFTEEAEELWEIAKSCKTSEAAIREVNDLSGTVIPANTLLLIPM